MRPKNLMGIYRVDPTDINLEQGKTRVRHSITSFFVAGMIPLAGCQPQTPAVDADQPPRKEVFQMSDAPDLPFSSAVRAGDLLFLSGQIGNVPGTLDLVEGGIGPETRQTLDNIESVLDYAGSSMERIVKCTVFLQDIDDYTEMNAVYTEVFGVDPPARSTVAGSGLAIGASVEIECIALAGLGN